MQTIEEFKMELQNLIDKQQFDDVKIKFISFIKEHEERNVEKIEIAQLYADYAFLMFDLAEYEDFFLAMDQAINLNYSKTVYKEILLEAFINPNIEQLKSTYNSNIQEFLDRGLLKKEQIKTFEELNYIVPVGKDNEFYIICKYNLVTKRKVSLQQQLSLDESNRFSHYLILDDNVHIISKLSETANQNYILVEKISDFLTSLQLEIISPNKLKSIERIFYSLEDFEMYFLNSEKYIPKSIINNSKNISNRELSNKIDDLMAKRNSIIERPRPLLTIGIPTYNRGERALKNVKEILGFPFDFEIEIVVSNNGTENETACYYEEIRKLKDSRVNYFEFEENQGVSKNICKVAELANGDFVLLLSDEDSINLQALYNVMADLKNVKDEISIYRTSSLRQHHLPKLIKNKGKDALLTFGLTSNYLSGNIFKVDLLKQYNVINYVRNNQENEICYLYPHMCFELFLVQYGKVISTDEILIFEGEAEETEVAPKEFSQNAATIPTYAFLEERLKQHASFVGIFKDMEIIVGDEDLYREAYVKLVHKTFHLISIAIDLYYAPNNYNLKEVIDKCYVYCVEKDFLIGNRVKRKRDLKVVEDIYKSYLLRYVKL
ncbi:MAG: glycosyltransferase [Solibacillus sp.]